MRRSANDGSRPAKARRNRKAEAMSESLRRGYPMAAAILIAVVLVVVGRYLGWLHVPLVVE